MTYSTTHIRDVSFIAIVFYIAINVVVGTLLIVVPTTVYITLSVGIVAIYFIVKKPERGVMSIVILISSVIFEESLPLIPIGIGSLHISDIILLVLIIKILVNIFQNSNIRYISTPLDIPLILFAIVIIVSGYSSIYKYGLDFSTVIRTLRGLMYYMIFFIVTNLITEKKQILFIVYGLYTTAIIVSLLMILQSIIGDSFQLLPGRIESAGTFMEYEALRILPPGQTLIFCLLLTTISYYVISNSNHKLTSVAFFSTIILGIGVILTYNRTYWVAIILSIGLMLSISIYSERIRIVRLLVILILMGSALAVYSTLTGTLHETGLAVSARFSSIFAGKELRESGPVDDRATENMYAMRKIAESPLLGIGLGNDYRPSIYGKDDILHNYIHNGYLYLLLITGSIGTILFLWFYIGFLIRGIIYTKTINDPCLRSVVTGNVLSGAGIVFVAFANPIFMQWFSIVVIAIITGLNETIFRINSIEASKSYG